MYRALLGILVFVLAAMPAMEGKPGSCYFRRSREFGIVNGNFTVDMRAVRERKRRMVSGWNEAYLQNYKKSGAELILGSGRFIGPKTLEATLLGGTTRQLRGTNVIVNTGTHASSEPIPGLAEAQPLTHTEQLAIPGHNEHRSRYSYLPLWS